MLPPKSLLAGMEDVMRQVVEETMACPPGAETALPERFRELVAERFARWLPARGHGMPRVERLGSGRWRIEGVADGGADRVECYVSAGCDTVLTVRACRGFWVAWIEGDLTGEAAVNLGDCLLRAVCLGARKIVLRTRPEDAASTEGEGVVESFARCLARNASQSVTIRGRGPSARSLARAWDRGLARPTSRRTV